MPIVDIKLVKVENFATRYFRSTEFTKRTMSNVMSKN